MRVVGVAVRVVGVTVRVVGVAVRVVGVAVRVVGVAVRMVIYVYWVRILKTYTSMGSSKHSFHNRYINGQFQA